MAKFQVLREKHIYTFVFVCVSTYLCTHTHTHTPLLACIYTNTDIYVGCRSVNHFLEQYRLFYIECGQLWYIQVMKYSQKVSAELATHMGILTPAAGMWMLGSAPQQEALGVRGCWEGSGVLAGSVLQSQSWLSAPCCPAPACLQRSPFQNQQKPFGSKSGSPQHFYTQAGGGLVGWFCLLSFFFFSQAQAQSARAAAGCDAQCDSSPILKLLGKPHLNLTLVGATRKSFEFSQLAFLLCNQKHPHCQRWCQLQSQSICSWNPCQRIPLNCANVERGGEKLNKKQWGLNHRVQMIFGSPKTKPEVSSCFHRYSPAQH